MAQPHIQTSFHAGEWAPALNARVDQAKYHSAAALLRNFFVDYRGGASSCVGTKYMLQARSVGAWLIPFQASLTVGYVLEFGANYIRFYNNGAPVLETATVISGATQANPGVIADIAHGYAVGDWVYITAVGGMTQLNGKYYIINTVPDANHYTLTDLNGTVINTTTYSAYTAGGTARRVFTLQSPYAVADVSGIKFAQNVTYMILCHPLYPPYVLTLVSATNWTLVPATFGSTIPAPTGTGAVSTLAGGGTFDYSYEVTAIDVNGQESAPSAVANVIQRTAAAAAVLFTNTVTWNSVPGAQFYNVYSISNIVHSVGVATGQAYGFVGYCTSVTFNDTGYASLPTAPDYQITPPVVQNPFLGAGVASVAVTAPGAYATVPTITFDAAPAGGQTATGTAVLNVIATGVIVDIVGSHTVGQVITFNKGVVLIVKTVAGGVITAFQALTYPGTSVGSITSGAAPATVSTSSGGVTVGVTWGVGLINLTLAGAGYTAVPAITFSAGAAAATATLASNNGNPTVPCFFQQRLVLAGPVASPATFYMSQPGAPYNYNITYPVQADNAITGTLVSSQLNAITNMVPMPGGLLMFTANNIWQVNGGTAGAVITAQNITAQAQSYVGASNVPPIVANYNVLFVQAKGSIVRDLTYSFNTNIFTGSDISILSSHLFYGYSILQWAWAEEPFKLVWAVRNDGILLSLTYLKEQEFIGWAHRDTLGLFTSIAKVTEATSIAGNVDAVYVVVQRTIGGATVQYIERMAERSFPYGVEDAWAVDAALQSAGTTPAATLSASQSGTGTGVTFTASASVFNSGMVGNVIRMGGGIATITAFTSGTQVTGTITQAISATLPDSSTNSPLPQSSGNWTLWVPFTTFSGLDHLNGQIVVGLADGTPVGPFTVSAGAVTLSASATKVTLGLAFTPQLQTLALDLGEPTIQGKRKQIPAVTARVKDTLGLYIGRSFLTLVPMKDLVVGNVGTMTNARVTNLVTGDARTLVDPLWDVPGQYCFQLNQPYPASILGVIPEITVGDTPSARQAR